VLARGMTKNRLGVVNIRVNSVDRRRHYHTHADRRGEMKRDLAPGHRLAHELPVEHEPMV